MATVLAFHEVEDFEVPDPSILPEILATDEAAAAMRHDGVRPETLVMLEETT